MKAFWYNEERKNVCGIRIRELRKEKSITIKKLETMATLAGYDFITQNAITKIEHGIRFVPDYEVSIFAELLDTTPEFLLNPEVVKKIYEKIQIYKTLNSTIVMFFYLTITTILYSYTIRLNA